MGITFTEADITRSNCDAYLFTDIHDWPERLHTDPNFIEVVKYQAELETREGWGPGRMVRKPPREGSKDSKFIIFAHHGNPPDYAQLRSVLLRLKENYEKLEIKTIAMPRTGTGSGLHWRVIRQLLVNLFSEENPPSGLILEVFETDIPGRDPD